MVEGGDILSSLGTFFESCDALLLNECSKAELTTERARPGSQGPMGSAVRQI